MTNKKHEALRLADCLEGNATTPWTREEAATELRRLHAENQALRENSSNRIVELEGHIAEMEEQLLAEATPVAWYVTGCSTMLDEHDAKSEAKRCGGSAKAVPLYTAPPDKHGD